MIKLGVLKNCILWIEYLSLENINKFMNYLGIVIILVIGGNVMVKVVYLCGKLVFGVGVGNVLVYIEKIVNIKIVINDIVLFKLFDNGMVCVFE